MTTFLNARTPLALAALVLLQTAPTTPAMAQTSGACVDYSIRICAGYQAELGYSSLKDCRLQEYANCMAGAPPYNPTEPIRFLRGATGDKHHDRNTAVLISSRIS
ncbi:hypothetical protein [Sphingomonas sp. NFR04]|uniref:hypothetical protein n=1 Tax=Sphingomonas sp. NFR04 TaxID=1566283 RepID=UPI001113DEF3|nr:hypothetical protein [Sphingomonas sp. NFR04]